MFHVHDRSNEKQRPNYCVKDDCDEAYPAVAAAKEAKLKGIHEEMRFHLRSKAGRAAAETQPVVYS